MLRPGVTKFHVFLYYIAFRFSFGNSLFHFPTHVYRCPTNKTFTANSAYQFNLDTLLASLSSAAATGTREFYNTTAGGRNTADTVYGSFMCRGDVPRQVCQDCVANGTQQLATACELKKEGIIWYQECFIRYSNRNFFSIMEEQPRINFFNTRNVTDNSSKTNLTLTLGNALGLVVAEAANSGPEGTKKFARKRVGLSGAEYDSVYALAECTPDLSSQDCDTCLRDALGDVPLCCLGKAGGRVVSPSCRLRFEFYQFYGDGDINTSVPQSPLQTTPFNSSSGFTENNKKDRSPSIALVVTVPVVVSTILCSFCCYLIRRKIRKSNYKTLLKQNFGHDIDTLEALQFDLITIEVATNNFSHENKIGKGGFGEVYKGILADGRHIAVKRLSTNSKQGSIEFKNEILLIAKLQHRNLVALIGFCLEVQEKILIYEYMSNGSLDSFLFDTQKQKLSWAERYKIMDEIALGVLYLHEYSRLKVIHRDLKPSNVLLDNNMNPKISDFGMARIIDIDQDREKTNRIVGTYGYMSPEYAMLGQFSEKSDVFSFGVVILEIITGKRIVGSYNKSHQVADSLMNYVWRQWKDQSPLSILDSNIKENYSSMEVIKCIHIGLLCVQENPNTRPTMATVISYLNSHTLELPSPQEPAFVLQDSMDKRVATHNQESSPSQFANDATPSSVNMMSTSNFYPR